MVSALPPASGTMVDVRVTQALKYRVVLPSALEPVACSRLGGSRFVCNHMLSVVKANRDQIAGEKTASGDGLHTTEYVSTSHFGLLHVWQDVLTRRRHGGVRTRPRCTTTPHNDCRERSRTGGLDGSAIAEQH